MSLPKAPPNGVQIHVKGEIPASLSSVPGVSLATSRDLARIECTSPLPLVAELAGILANLIYESEYQAGGGCQEAADLVEQLAEANERTAELREQLESSRAAAEKFRASGEKHFRSAQKMERALLDIHALALRSAGDGVSRVREITEILGKVVK